MDFSDALRLVKNGKLLARSAWNGRRHGGRTMFIYLVDGSRFEVNRPPLNKIFPEGTPISYHAHIDMRTAQGDCVPWLASQADLLAGDWEEVGEDGLAVPTEGEDLIDADRYSDEDAAQSIGTKSAP